MAQLELHRRDIEQAGASLAYIAAQKHGGMFKPEEYLKEHPVSFPYLLDEDRAVTKKYGVYMPVGVDGFNIARMATMVVDGSKTVRWIYVAANQFHPAEIADVLKEVRDLSKS